jgi:hypothetical protein
MTEAQIKPQHQNVLPAYNLSAELVQRLALMKELASPP